ncbi:FKBP-type peptidyl-prolyl cis-trans isomerase [Algoriphagus pacificus]|uniref:Peptidyl-prolyl cis-trans isomerase n=1 Tax=Algoriphagus pacificus TaxID=2811234 RepID=A0ABS3CBL9_9BACT|nr:FKBP-type peptidyl-prolyl cis-trans isomerase [Algoriphagus pacificus]MBN7814490.1 FKBP-type peptidyl-prolyl cis-trans isomerase [Algoriphagus pacificus]
MKINLYSVFTLLLGSVVLFSCIDEQETSEAIFQEDKAAIENYLDTASIVNVKEYSEEAAAYYVIWQELSNSKDSVFVGDTVQVHYTGKFLSGKVFDTSIESVAKANGLYNANYNYLPLSFKTGSGYVLPAFEFGINLMEVGDKATIILPSELGYGRTGQGPVPANTPLVFEVELMGIKPGPRDNN